MYTQNPYPVRWRYVQIPITRRVGILATETQRLSAINSGGEKPNDHSACYVTFWICYIKWNVIKWNNNAKQIWITHSYLNNNFVFRVNFYKLYAWFVFALYVSSNRFISLVQKLTTHPFIGENTIRKKHYGYSLLPYWIAIRRCYMYSTTISMNGLAIVAPKLTVPCRIAQSAL